jgi:hypothetical protein
LHFPAALKFNYSHFVFSSCHQSVSDLTYCFQNCHGSRRLKETHMPTACFKQAFMKVALDRPGKFSLSKQSRSDVPPKKAPLVDFSGVARLS